MEQGAEDVTGHLSPRDKAPVHAGRDDADDPRRRQARAVGGAVGSRWWRRRERANRPCCISPALLESPDDGEVYVGGFRDVGIVRRRGEPRSAAPISAFVYQSHRLLPEFSALENVMLPQMIRGLRRSETVKRATEILAYLGLGDRIQAPPGGTVRRRAAAGGDRSRGVANAPAGAARGRADRQSRPAHCTTTCSRR